METEPDLFERFDQSKDFGIRKRSVTLKEKFRGHDLKAEPLKPDNQGQTPNQQSVGTVCEELDNYQVQTRKMSQESFTDEISSKQYLKKRASFKQKNYDLAVGKKSLDLTIYGQ